MPYITQSKRKPIDDAVTKVAIAIMSLPDKDSDGAFNYAVTRLILIVFGKTGYGNFVRVAGSLEEIKAEYRRRMVAPYEDMKKDQNGDAYGAEA